MGALGENKEFVDAVRGVILKLQLYSSREVTVQSIPNHAYHERGRLRGAVKHVKGVINLVTYKLCSLRVHDITFLYIHIFSYP